MESTWMVYDVECVVRWRSGPNGQWVPYVWNGKFLYTAADRSAAVAAACEKGREEALRWAEGAFPEATHMNVRVKQVVLLMEGHRTIAVWKDPR